MNRMGPEVRGIASRPTPIDPSSTDTWFQDCIGGDPSTGTALEQSWFNQLLAKFRDLFTSVGNPPVNDHMLTAAIALQTQQNKMRFGDDIGTLNHIQVVLDPVPTSLPDGMEIVISPDFANTGAVDLTVNTVSGNVVKPLKRNDGLDLRPNDIRSPSRLVVIRDMSVADCWRVSAWVPSQFVKLVNLTGTSHTYVPGDVSQITNRSNSGAAMTDTLPGTGGTGVLPAESMVQIRNNDATALLAISAGPGATILGEIGGWLYLGPSQNATVMSDGANYVVVNKPTRTKLGANTTMYVSTAGNDANAGHTSAASWRNMQRAWTMIQGNFDLNGYVVTVQVANGSYSASGAPVLSVSGIIPGQRGPANVVFQGNTGTASACLLTNSGTQSGVLQAYGGAQVTFQGFQITSSLGSAIDVSGSGTIVNYGYINFGACTWHVVTNTASLVVQTNDCNIIGPATQHWNIANSSTFAPRPGVKISMSAAAFSGSFVAVTGANWSEDGANAVTFIGSATGQRYSATLNGVINTQGSGASYFPGSSAGSTSAGGQYN